MPAANGLTTRTRIVPYPAGAFEWDDTSGGPFTVDTWVAGPPATLKLNTLAPASLKNAIDAGLKPRLQVVSTSANPVNGLVRATAWVDGGGKTTLTLENPLPSDFVAPIVGDAVHAGGPAVIPVATAQLAYVNGLGPSRASGYADPNDAWNDTVETEQLARIALDAADGSGNPLAKNIVKTAGVPQVTIAVGGGAPSTNDYVTGDDGVNAPECAFAVHVIVTA